jgi:hypothetical protein
MIAHLEEMIENGEISEIEIIDFVRTLKKLTNNNFMDKRNVGLVIDYFGMKKKKSWLKVRPGTRVKL